MDYKNMREEDKVSVLIATYNGAEYIAEQIESVLKQTYKNIICYIHDDGSSDETKRIIENYAKDYPKIIQVINAPKCGGAKKNFMFLLTCTKEKYVAFCDQDDVWSPNKIQSLLLEMKRTERKDRPCLVFSDLKVVDKELNVISESYYKFAGKNPERTYYKQILIQNFVPGCTMMINREAVKLSLKYSNLENIFMHDWWIISLVSLLGDISRVKESLVMYRQHGDNSIGADKKLDFVTFLVHAYETIFGNHKEKIMQRIYISRNMAKELYQLPGVNYDDRCFLEEFSNIGKRDKISRIKFYKDNKLFRNNHRNWLMLLFV